MAKETEETSIPYVDIIQPMGQAPDQQLLLPGQAVAFSDAPIYARTSGYLKRWTADIGAHVKQGELLAQIEAPELDQQLRHMEDHLRRSIPVYGGDQVLKRDFYQAIKRLRPAPLPLEEQGLPG